MISSDTFFSKYIVNPQAKGLSHGEKAHGEKAVTLAVVPTIFTLGLPHTSSLSNQDVKKIDLSNEENEAHKTPIKVDTVNNKELLKSDSKIESNELTRPDFPPINNELSGATKNLPLEIKKQIFEPKILKDSGSSGIVTLEWDSSFNQPVIVKKYFGFLGKFLKKEADLLNKARERGVFVPTILKETALSNGYQITTTFFPKIDIEDKTILESISLSNRFKIVQELVKEVALLHASGICHNDLNITNILFDGVRVQLIDFGAAVIDNDTAFDIKSIAELMINILALHFDFEEEDLSECIEKVATTLGSLDKDMDTIKEDLNKMLNNQITAEELSKRKWLANL